MRSKHVVRMVLSVLSTLALAGCAVRFPFGGQDSERMIVGEVSSIENDSVTLLVGIRKETEGEKQSDLELTGEELEIKLTADTVIRLQDDGGKTKEVPAEIEETAPEVPAETEETAPEAPAETEETAPEAPAETEETAPEAPAETEESFPEAPAETEESSPEAPADQELSAEDLREGDVLSVTLDKKEKPLEILILFRGRPNVTGKLRDPEDYNAAAEFVVDSETDGETYASTGADENAVHVLGEARVTLKNAEITRTSRDSTGGSTASRYGVGAALLTNNGTSYIRDSIITTNAPGGAGIFSYGDGVTYALNTEITTQHDTSGGIQVAAGGTLYAWNLDIKTQGASSAAVKSDRGGGVMIVDGGSYQSDGVDSPAVYCMADMAVHGAKLTANASGAAVVEGGNTLRLYDCDLTGNMEDNLQNDSAWNVLLYESTSQDEVWPNIFEMQDGTLAAGNGGIFYTTNGESVITLSDVKIVYPEVRDYFLKCTGNDNHAGWGTIGANGADCLFTADNQDMEGDIIWDDISRLDFYMTKKSTLRGAVLNEKNEAGANPGYCNLYIEDGCTWTVTGDSTLTQLSGRGKLEDDEGGTVTIQGIDGTVYVQGSGKYTVTVHAYETEANMSGASEMTRWMDHQVKIPE